MEQEFQSLFKKCKFQMIKEGEPLSEDSLAHLKRLVIPPNVESFHPRRAHEFKLGRLCASLAHQSLLAQELTELAIGPKREPLWPSTVRGSISHCDGYVCAAVGEATQVEYVGIDIEVWGRVKSELKESICLPGELESLQVGKTEETLTLIFSAKESLYKALFPKVGRYFGFHAALVDVVQITHSGKPGKFQIILKEQLNDKFGPQGSYKFSGSYLVQGGVLLTVIEA